MRKLISFCALSFGVVALWQCAPANRPGPLVNTAAEGPVQSFAGQKVAVEAPSENVRANPNGRILGKMRQGDSLQVIEQVGNWIYFRNQRFNGAYIWGPSVGFEYRNLYSTAFYYDRTRQGFYDIYYFQTAFFQKGQRRQETQNSYELFFKDIGLGRHDEIVLDAEAQTQQVVEHGVTLFVRKSDQRITRVRVDFFRPVKGFAAALEKCGLMIKDPGETNSGHLIWPAGDLVPGLMVDLERREWDSDYFSSVWFILPE